MRTCKEAIIKDNICEQIQNLSIEELEDLTDAIENGITDGLTNPPEVLSCPLCAKLYGEAGCSKEECRRRWQRYMSC